LLDSGQVGLAYHYLKNYSTATIARKLETANHGK